MSILNILSPIEYFSQKHVRKKIMPLLQKTLIKEMWDDLELQLELTTNQKKVFDCYRKGLTLEESVDVCNMEISTIRDYRKVILSKILTYAKSKK